MVGRLVIAIVFSALVVSASLAEDSEPAEAPSISAAELAAPGGVALYCRVGPRPRMGESALLAAGYEKVFHLEGGLAGGGASRRRHALARRAARMHETEIRSFRGEDPTRPV